MMNQTETKIILIIATAFILSSCGNNKSAEGTDVSENTLSSSATSVLASCNKLSNSDLSISANAINNFWIKTKFSFLSASTTASGNIIKFYQWKWNMTLNRAEVDPNPLQIYDYATSSFIATQLTASSLNDPNKAYSLALTDAQAQVLKVVVYSSTGAPLSNHDLLIPLFDANLSVYNSTHAAVLQSKHPLVNTNTTGWSDADFTNYFQAFCF